MQQYSVGNVAAVCFDLIVKICGWSIDASFLQTISIRSRLSSRRISVLHSWDNRQAGQDLNLLAAIHGMLGHGRTQSAQQVGEVYKAS